MRDNTILLRFGLTAIGDMGREEGEACVVIKGVDNTNTRIVLTLSKKDLNALVTVQAAEQVAMDRLAKEFKEENPG